MNDIVKAIQSDLSQTFNQDLKFSESFGDVAIEFPKEKLVPLMTHLKTRHRFN